MLMKSPELSELLGDPVLGSRLRSALTSARWSDVLVGAAPSVEAWDVRVLKYRPERRLCARLGLMRSEGPDAPSDSSWILKIWYNRRGERIDRRLRQLTSMLAGEAALNSGRDPGSASGLRVPAPCFYEPKAHGLVYPWIEGATLTELLRRGNASLWVKPFARALVRLHRSDLDDLKSRTPTDELALISKAIAADGFPPEAIAALGLILAKLSRDAPAFQSTATLHRDLYDQQVLRLGDGAFYMIDLDDMASGDPMLDLGNFTAHVHLITHWRRRPEKLARLRDRLLREYAKAAGEPVSSFHARYRWYEAVALARLAIHQARRARRERSLELVEAAGLVLFESESRDAVRTSPPAL